MRREDLVAHYPRLHHMAEAGRWPAIRDAGLLTTAQLVDACGVDAGLRAEVLERPRTRSYALHHPVAGPVVVRDQGPLREPILRRALVGTTVAEWLHELNTHVFFWPHPRRLAGLLAARRYRDRAHDVLVLDTAALLDAHGDAVRLTPMNTGSALFPGAPARGRGTFMTVEEFPFAERRRGRALADTVVELAVAGGVPDIADLVLRVERRHGPEVVDVLWERPGDSR